MQCSDDLAEIASALAKVQGAIKGAVKDSTNPHFRNAYADLSSVWDACRAELSANGIAVVQGPGLCVEGQMELTTLMTHSSGQWIKSTLSIPLSKVDAQGYGSATTYARRYALAAMVGVAPEDDDGNAASRPSDNAVRNDRVRPSANRPAPLKGKHKTREALKEAINVIVAKLKDTKDPERLDTILSEEKDTVDQCREEHPFWWNGDGGDFIGLDGEIQQAYRNANHPTQPLEALNA